MAATETQTVKNILRGDEIVVTVESIVPDIIVVSFVNGVKSFQGALLDVNKRGLPCGINSPEPTVDRHDDKSTTLATRFTYFQEKDNSTISSSVSSSKFDVRKNFNSTLKVKKAGRPTVRLRPRQVLCNRCQSICNEQNENVGIGKKRKQCDDRPGEQENNPIPAGSSINRRSERRCVIQQQTDKNDMNRKTVGVSSLIPKISRLDSTKFLDNSQSNQLERNIQLCWLRSAAAAGELLESENRREFSNTLNSQMTTTTTQRQLINKDNENGILESSKPLNNVTTSKKKTLAAADSTIKNTTKTSEIQRLSRRKRSIGSMEDLWDENIFEDIIKSSNTSVQVTPVIKISFGSHGEGTVLKIPSKVKSSSDKIYEENENAAQLSEDNENSTEQLKLDTSLSLNEPVTNSGTVEPQIDLLKSHGKDVACAKAAKRALKKAKKEARRKIVNGGTSPARSPLNSSPRYNPSYEPLLYRRRKHKVKHKKKHKDERKQHKNQELNTDLEIENTKKIMPTINKQEQEVHRSDCNIFPAGESYTTIKEQCLKQKLSISLKRLNANAYTRCDYPVSNASSGCKSPDISSEELSEPDQEQSSENNVETNHNISEFSTSHPLSIRFAATPVAHCLTANGRRMDVGDIVWGKIHGFPWWPGKVLSISVSCKDDGTSAGAQAHVAWYGSSTCSLMSCDRLSPFLETFKARYNKKKRGPYKEAIKQAQSEAQTQMSLSDSTTNNVTNVCKSPHEVNVVS